MLSVAHTPPIRPLMLGVGLVLALLLCGAAATALSYRDQHRMVGAELQLRFLSGQLLALQTELSQSARLAAETGDPQWVQRYRAATPRFEAALRETVATVPADLTLDSTVWTASAALSGTEATAIERLQQGRRAEALQLLTSADYQIRQRAVVDGLNRLSTDLLRQAQARLSLQRRLMLGTALLGLALLGALGAAWVWISGLVQQYLQAVQQADAQLAEHNRLLDARVRERTAELQAVNQQLREEMEQRSRIEDELRQSQKLEAIGRLAAGVAHEINTPVQFVSDHCHFIQQSVGELLGVLDRYQHTLQRIRDGELSPDAAAQELDAVRRTADVDFLATQLPPSAAHALDGLNRIAQIVRSMKDYAHPGDRQRMKIDLNRVVAGALTLATSQIKPVADVATDYGELPEIYCFPGELGQVVLNLLVNATHAIEAAIPDRSRRGHISIVTRREGAEVSVRISDDGCGISDAIRDRIFEPFFTTKTVGQGTGQGLALARTIVVDKHRGRLEVETTQGHGATFTLSIPVDARAESMRAQAA